MTRISYNEILESGNSIARTLLVKRNVDKDVEYDEIETPSEDGKSVSLIMQEIFQISQIWYFNKRDQNDIGKLEKERLLARNSILKLEDTWFVDKIKIGDDKNLVSISDTKTVRYDLLKALKEFAPCCIITSSKWLNPVGFDVFECPYVEKNVHYLVPIGKDSKVDRSVAEFIISKDINEWKGNEKVGGNTRYELSEWIAVEVKNPNKFVKVCRKKT